MTGSFARKLSLWRQKTGKERRINNARVLHGVPARQWETRRTIKHLERRNQKASHASLKYWGCRGSV